jgi:hypothetical protein
MTAIIIIIAIMIATGGIRDIKSFIMVVCCFTFGRIFYLLLKKPSNRC